MPMGPMCLFLVMMVLLTRQSPTADSQMYLVQLLDGQPKEEKDFLGAGGKQAKCY